MFSKSKIQKKQCHTLDNIAHLSYIDSIKRTNGGNTVCKWE